MNDDTQVADSIDVLIVWARGKGGAFHALKIQSTEALNHGTVAGARAVCGFRPSGRWRGGTTVQPTDFPCCERCRDRLARPG